MQTVAWERFGVERGGKILPVEMSYRRHQENDLVFSECENAARIAQYHTGAVKNFDAELAVWFYAALGQRVAGHNLVERCHIYLADEERVVPVTETGQESPLVALQAADFDEVQFYAIINAGVVVGHDATAVAVFPAG